MSAAQQRAEADAERLQAALGEAVEASQVGTLFPLQREALACSLRCFDRAKTTAALTECSQACEATVAAASAAFSAQLQAFQQRLGRCAAGCSDAAQGRLGPDPSPKAVAAAQNAMSDCVAGCASSHAKELPTLKARLAADASKAAAAAAAAVAAGRR